jgi:hypothetical protein
MVAWGDIDMGAVGWCGFCVRHGLRSEIGGIFAGEWF